MFNLKQKSFTLLLFSTTTSSLLYADISGIVYKDFNMNGIKDGNDAAVIGIEVTAVCENSQTYRATTTTTGAYRLSGFPAGNKCRVEANTTTAGVGSGTNAPGSAPIVDVVADGETHNISTGSSATYCQSNPDVIMAAMPGYYTRNANSTGGGVRPDDSFGTVFKVPAPSTGEFNANSTISTKRTVLATFGQTGAIWGSAWKKGTNSLFVSAALKRYVPLKSETTATEVAISAGTIYKIDTTTTPATLSSFAVIPNTLSSTAATELSHRDYGYNQDLDVIKYTGRMGLGDLEISEDETKLYTINMNSKELIVMNASTGTILQSILIPNPYSGGECSADKVRPWALKIRGEEVFIGSVCEDKVENDLGATIQKYDGMNFQTIAMTNSLRYLRARAYRPAGQVQDDGYRFRNWTNNFADAPMLTDIEFTNSGDIVLGYNSRATYNRGQSLRGDIRKMCLNGDGTYTDESTDITTTTCASHIINHEDNPTDYYEFYFGDYFGTDLGGNGHPETASGALAQAPGAPNIIVGMIDATDWYQPGAIGNYDNISGDKIGAQAVIDNIKVAEGGEREAYGSKAGGMGDIELLCDPAPIEIGNLVWIDGNQDGIQDPNEPGAPGITVTLACNGTDIGTATTDITGHYYFGGLNNVNLTGTNRIIAGESCQLRIAQASVNNKPPTITDPNGNSEDQHDNDAIASGSDNVINFTTSVSNNHSLDFGITPTIGCLQGQLYDDADNSNTHENTEQVASNVTLKVKDSFGGEHTLVTDASGNYQFTGIPAGSVTLNVDVSDTDIPEGSVWYAHTFTVNVPESSPGSCTVQDARLYIPAPIDQDPKDVATCANPTSITWEGANPSSHSVWHNMLVNSSLSTAKTFTTVGGSVVDVKMYINNPDNEFNNAQAGTYNGSNTAGTDGAFNDPYLTLYLGDQATAGNGIYNDASACAANGYDLTSGEKVELIVEFSEKVILDNWRIRDVDSGDDRGGVSNWEWQDGIEVEAFDENGNRVEVESKIGSSGLGLIKDVNGTVHTDSSSYDAGGGDFATGIGTTPNGTNGHIVLTSNFVPIKKLVITHVAGPDMACQTRSALAMAGLALCKPLHISGTVYDDRDGSKLVGDCETSNQIIDGNPISKVDGLQLNACLIGDNNLVLDKQAVAPNGEYDFSGHLKPNSTYKVLITKESCTIGVSAPNATLPEGWEYEGEISNISLDDDHNGKAEVALSTTNVIGIDFSINKKPIALGYNRPRELNPNGTVQVDFDVTGSAVMSDFIKDYEETTPSKIRLTRVPSDSKVYYNGALITLGQVITNPNISNFKIDPIDGDTTVSFEYITIDEACRESEPAIFKAPFKTLNISGRLFFDTTEDNQVNGTETPHSCDSTTPLYVSLINDNNKVLSSVQLSEDGSYAFHSSDGVRRDTSYTLVLSSIAGVIGQDAPEVQLSSGCTNFGETNSTTVDGKIPVSTQKSDLTELNFAITTAAEIGDRVWYDLNKNGEQDIGEEGVDGVNVKLMDASCTTTLKTTTTDVNGNYIFTPLTPDSYCLEFALPSSGYLITKQNIATESVDSDVDPTTKQTGAITLSPGESDMSWDMGIYPCDCGTYESGSSDSVPALNIWSMLIIILSSSAFGFFFIKRELKDM